MRNKAPKTDAIPANWNTLNDNTHFGMAYLLKTVIGRRGAGFLKPNKRNSQTGWHDHWKIAVR
jgi:hypothetical protein